MWNLLGFKQNLRTPERRQVGSVLTGTLAGLLACVAFAGGVSAARLSAADGVFYAADNSILFGLNTLDTGRPAGGFADGEVLPFGHHVGNDPAMMALTHGLHFGHPLVTETPTPDSKLRVDYFHTRINDAGTKARIHTLHAELEAAWRNLFSVSVSVPYVFTEVAHAPRQSHFDNVEIALKMANYALSDIGIVYGGGIEVSLPAGEDSKDIGSNHIVSYAPFLDVGYETGKLQAILFVTFEMATHQLPGEEVENSVAFDLAFLYQATDWCWGVAEMNTDIPLTTSTAGHAVVNLTPGIKVQPIQAYDFVVGLGVSLPVSETKDFEYNVILSTFLHF